MPVFSRSRKIEDLERRVSRLQAALRQSSEVAGRWTAFRREVTAAIAVLVLALGFTLGVYREPIQQAGIGLAQTLGIAKGNSDAAYDAYQEGRYATALRLARPLAAEGDARAQSVLGLLYYRGFGVPQDEVEAVKWFRNAADRGDARAQYHLGLFYANGEAGETDNVSAHLWFNLASARFPASEISYRSAARTNRDLVAEKMTPDQIAEAQKLAREWKPKSN
jgi:TPR repeat protein